MEPIEKPAIDSFRRRIHAILQSSFQWVSWQRALEVTLLEEYLGDSVSHISYCVDNHLLIEFLLPRPLKTLSSEGAPSASLSLESYPRPVDLALFLLMGTQAPINILPSHHQEFFYKVKEWQRQLSIQNEKLNLFQAALDRLIMVVEEDDGSSDARDRFRHFLDAVLSEEGSFGGILALETQGVRSVAAIKDRLRVVAVDSLMSFVETWDSSIPRKRIDVLFNALSVMTRGRATPSSTRIDAHALYLLEKENENLPDHSYLVLLTQSAKIWSLLSNKGQCAEIGFKNQRGRVWLIQPPEVILVSTMVNKIRSEGEGEAGEREARRLLILDLEQNRRLRLIRDEVEHQILPRLDMLARDSAEWEDCQLRVKELEKGLRELKSIAQDRDRLLTLRLGLDAPQNWGGALFRALRSLRDAPQAELRSKLSWELERLRKRMRDLEEQMLIAAPLAPDDNEGLDEALDEVSPELQSVVRNQSEGIDYFIRLQSANVVRYFDSIYYLLGEFDGKQGVDREVVELHLHAVMRDAKRNCQEDVEYQLMLAVLYANRGLWFEAYVAANQCLRRLSSLSLSAAGIELVQVEIEAQLLKGAALQHWALARYSGLPQFVGQFLEEAAECIRKALSIGSRRALPGSLGTGRDPRALRELATIYGNAREVEEFSRKTGRLKDGQGLVAFVEADLELAGLDTRAPMNLLNLYRVLAEKAYAGAVEVPSMYYLFVNTLLFALVEEDDGRDSPKKDELVRELDELSAREERINYLDTLAWFYYRKARYVSRMGGDPSVDLQRAGEYISRAKVKLRKAKKKQVFFEQLIRVRENELKDFKG
jgi:hypothetical protein